MIGFLNLEVVTSKIDQAHKETARITKVTIIIFIINVFKVNDCCTNEISGISIKALSKIWRNSLIFLIFDGFFMLIPRDNCFLLRSTPLQPGLQNQL